MINTKIDIKNNKDPTGCGMFSRYGQVLTEQHNIFLKKEDIMQGNARARKFNYSVLQKVLTAHQFEHLGASQQAEEAEEQSQSKLQLAIPEPSAGLPDFRHFDRDIKRRKKEMIVRKLKKSATPGPNKYHVKLAPKYCGLTQREHAGRLRSPNAGPPLPGRPQAKARPFRIGQAAGSLSQEHLVSREREVAAHHLSFISSRQTSSKLGIRFEKYLPRNTSTNLKTPKASESTSKEQKVRLTSRQDLNKPTTMPSINIIVQEPEHPEPVQPRSKPTFSRSFGNLNYKFDHYTPRKDWFDGVSLTSAINYDIDFKQVYNKSGSGVAFKKITGREPQSQKGIGGFSLAMSVIEPKLEYQK